MRELVVAASTGLLFAHTALRERRREPREWERQLRILRKNGFDALDLSELWLPMSELTDAEVQQLGNAIAANRMAVAGVSIIDADLGQEQRREQSRAKVLRALQVAKSLGARFLSIGFHALPTQEPFPGQWTRSAFNEHERIGRELTTLAQNASASDIQLSLEMYERGILDRSSNVLSIIAASGGVVGANPDLGNLLRAPWPLVEEWDDTLRHLAPRLNYWHVKNGIRTVLRDGSAIYQPTELQGGTIDYRSAIQVAVRNGFRGPLVIEHYGGDAIAQAASGRAYLEKIIEEVCAYDLIGIKGTHTK